MLLSSSCSSCCCCSDAIVGDFLEAVSGGFEAESTLLWEGCEFEFGEGGSSIDSCVVVSIASLFLVVLRLSLEREDLEILETPFACARV